MTINSKFATANDDTYADDGGTAYEIFHKKFLRLLRQSYCVKDDCKSFICNPQTFSNVPVKNFLQLYKQP